MRPARGGPLGSVAIVLLAAAGFVVAASVPTVGPNEAAEERPPTAAELDAATAGRVEERWGLAGALRDVVETDAGESVVRADGPRRGEVTHAWDALRVRENDGPTAFEVAAVSVTAPHVVTRTFAWWTKNPYTGSVVHAKGEIVLEGERGSTTFTRMVSRDDLASERSASADPPEPGGVIGGAAEDDDEEPPSDRAESGAALEEDDLRALGKPPAGPCGVPVEFAARDGDLSAVVLEGLR